MQENSNQTNQHNMVIGSVDVPPVNVPIKEPEIIAEPESPKRKMPSLAGIAAITFVACLFIPFMAWALLPAIAVLGAFAFIDLAKSWSTEDEGIKQESHAHAIRLFKVMGGMFIGLGIAFVAVFAFITVLFASNGGDQS